SSIIKTESPTERAISLMLYCMRSQMFVDGNKRTAMLAANHEMIMNGCGIISVPIEHQSEFTKLLVEFYETNNPDTLMRFVYDNCIDGLDLRAQEKYVQQVESSERSQIKESMDLRVRTLEYKKLHSRDSKHTNTTEEKASVLEQIKDLKQQPSVSTLDASESKKRGAPDR
ncbi:MAG: Fic family protein, partial [Eubacterium sp.]|nr:Fic family protein [Eubacterium sp.]